MNKPRLHPLESIAGPRPPSAGICIWPWSPGMPQPRFEGEGRVVAVDENQRTVTLDHGPILGLMPAMRMAFPVQPAEQLLDFRSVHWCDFRSRLVASNG